MKRSKLEPTSKKLEIKFMLRSVLVQYNDNKLMMTIVMTSDGNIIKMESVIHADAEMLFGPG